MLRKYRTRDHKEKVDRTNWFLTLADAREKLEAWRRDYNEVRPHSAIGYNVPIAMHYPDGAASPTS